MKLFVERRHPLAVLPARESEEAAGHDLTAVEDVEIQPGETKLIPIGIAVSFPDGYFMMVVPRSGLSYRTKLRVANSPGIVDSDYRGDLFVIAENISHHETITVYKGQRIAQAIFIKYEIPSKIIDAKNGLDTTNRGKGGLGSTG